MATKCNMYMIQDQKKKKKDFLSSFLYRQLVKFERKFDN